MGLVFSEPTLQEHYRETPALSSNSARHLETLGTGNHFIEVCLDENDEVWVMIHSGSRGSGNRIGTYFIQRAKKEMERWFIQLPDANLAYLTEGSDLFDDYVEAVGWAQDFAAENRKQMMSAIIKAVQIVLGEFAADDGVDGFCGRTRPVGVLEA